MEFLKNNKDEIVFIAMAVVIIAEQILPNITSVKANSTVQALKSLAIGVLKVFKRK
ncbi:hypothetical protein KAR91_33040 [Candidatus Pacearchaeota archaeon]|nr:hypothetical protein [Candidatus Pacearchaeota archaeon]